MDIPARDTLTRFRREVDAEWHERIAPFWIAHAPDARGGFRGYVAADLRVDERAERGVVLTSRILWTFSRAASRKLADRAYRDLVDRFVDREHGGVFWTLDAGGRPADTRKRTYAQAFAIYGLAEYGAIDDAVDLFTTLETRARDPRHDGYFETFERDWTLAADQRLSDVDRDEKKSMNAHLHVVEAYAALAAASGDPRVRDRLRALLELFLDRVVDPRGDRLGMFFDEDWTTRSDLRSFGHDVEASWLLCEAVNVVGDPSLTARVHDVALRMARSVLEHAVGPDGGIAYEASPAGIVDDDRHWWAQAEAVVGFLNAYQLCGDARFFDAALGVWEYIKRHLVDTRHGEWFWKVSRDGAPSLDLPKISLWKCPYHNGRMCFEGSRRLGEIERSLHGTDEV